MSKSVKYCVNEVIDPENRHVLMSKIGRTYEQ